MKTCPICNKEHEDNQQHLQNGDGVCATTVTFDDVVRAAGTSEGAKKGLEEVDWSVKATWTDAARKASADARRDGMKAHEEHDAEADDHFSKAETQNDYHWRAGEAHSATAMALRDDIGVNHFNAARSHKAAAAKAPSPEAKNLHERFYKLHGDKAAEHGRRSPMGGHHLMNASATTSADVVHCRASGASTDNLQATEWRLGETVAFMWMPAGVHTITAGFRSGSINLTVACDQQTADAVNASLRDWRDERPKQEPFGCVEHREQEASVRVGPSCGFEWRGDGVYLAAEPTKLGADNVNGKVHRSWSPSFTTDAEYAKAVERDGVLYFPDGVRGSRSNPARITGVDFCVGTLTNKPAFRAMSPVKAAEADAVRAAGTSEGVRKSWESRRTGSGKAIPHVSDDVYTRSEKVPKWNVPVSPLRDRDVGGRQLRQRLPEFSKADHEHAAKAHMEAASEHEKAWGETQEKAHKETFGKKPEFHDYRVSGVGRDEYSEEHKDALRHHALSKTDHTSAAHAHWKAAGHHGVTTEELKSKLSASDCEPTDSVHANCKKLLRADVADATPEEEAAYERCVEGGGSHTQAVEELRLKRKHAEAAAAAEKPTLESIHAKHAAALAAANAIAKAYGAARLTPEDIYERHTVTATGTSEGARKGWLIREGAGFKTGHAGQDFARARPNEHIRLSPDEYAEPGHVIGYIKARPDSQLGFMRGSHNNKTEVRVHVRKEFLSQTDG